MTIVYEGEPQARWVVLVVVWVVLFAAAIVWGVANEQLDIQSRASSALAAANLPGTVTVDGRDAVISGVADGARDDVAAVVAGVDGVRTVTFTDAPSTPPTVARPPVPVPGVTSAPAAPGTSAPADPPQPVPVEEPVAHLTATLEKGAIVIAGVVPSEEAAARVAAVAELIYAPFVTNELVVDGGVAAAPWVDHAADAIAVLPIIGTSGLTIEGDSAVLTAAAPTAARAAQLSGAVRRALGPDIAVEPAITVTGLTPPRFEGFTRGDGTVVVRGVVPSSEIAEAISGSLRSVYGIDNVVNELEAREGVDATFSLFRLPVALRLFAPFPQWDVTIVDDVITGSLRSGASFATGSAKLTAELEALLDIAAGILIRNPTLAMQIEGHTDSVGSAESNLRLSVARAESAQSYLAALGVDPARLTAVGYGEERPIGDNDTPEGRAQNRRVEFSFGPATGGP